MQFDFVKTSWLKSAVYPAATGLVLSLVLVLISGGGFPGIIFKPLLSALILAAVWIGAGVLLQKYIPDLMDEIFPENGSQNNSEPWANQSNPQEFKFDINDDLNSELLENGAEAGNQAVSEDIRISEAGTMAPPPGGPQPKVKKKAGADEVLVQGVPIKKDPELMARAIQHVLDKDDK